MGNTTSCGGIPERGGIPRREAARDPDTRGDFLADFEICLLATLKQCQDGLFPILLS